MSTWKWVVGGAALALVAAGGAFVGASWGDDGPSGVQPMAAGMHHGTTGRADDVGVEEDFLAEMVLHHQEAIDSAQELARSDRPAMRRFGRAIVRDQSAQVEQMESWLNEWYDGGAEATYEPMMRDLSDLEGDELDQVFLEDMVDHHHMAVMMSMQVLMDGLEHPEVRALARDIRTAQVAEIQMMADWLQDWFGVETHMMQMG